MIYPALNFSVVRLKETDSTNRYLGGIPNKQEIPEGLVVLSAFQFSGRGQRDSVWESEKGKNLTFSILLKPIFLEPVKHFFLSRVISLAVHDFIRTETTEQVSIKWPNDILAGNRKIAGILIENSVRNNTIEYCIAGIGININQVSFSSNIPNPVSLAMLTGFRYRLDDCLARVLNGVQKYYLQLQSGDYSGLNSTFEKHLFLKGVMAGYILSGKKITAAIEGVTDEGILLMRKEEGEKIQCHGKELVYP